MNPNDYCIPSIKLTASTGSPRKGGGWMAAITVYENSRWSDRPLCVDEPTRQLCMAISECLSTDAVRGEVIGPRLFDPVGTAGDPKATKERTVILVDAAIRIFAHDAGKYSEIYNYIDEPKAPQAYAKAATAVYAAAAFANADLHKHQDDVGLSAYAADHYAAYAGMIANAANCAAEVDDEEGDAQQRDQYIIARVIPVLDEMLAVAGGTHVEPACDDRAMENALQLTK